MFKLSFVHFESHVRHQVVSDLILHVGSGETCAQVALEVLLELAGEHLDKLSRLTILLQVRSIIDLFVAYCLSYIILFLKLYYRTFLTTLISSAYKA